MSEVSSDLQELLAKGIRASGFPFQAKIQHLLESAAGWSVVGSECSWRNDDKEGFLDIVASGDDISLAIECKRVGSVSDRQKKKHGVEVFEGAPKKSFVFLCRENESESYSETTRAVVTRFLDEADVADDPIKDVGISSEERFYEPASYETSLCVTVDLNDWAQMIEREVSELVRGTHHYAAEMYSFLWSVGASNDAVFLPVFVTTSPLFVLNCDPKDVSIEDGDFRFAASDIRPVSWIRFKKSFMAIGADSTDRTVFVVQAKSFAEFLEKLKPSENRGA